MYVTVYYFVLKIIKLILGNFGQTLWLSVPWYIYNTGFKGHISCIYGHVLIKNVISSIFVHCMNKMFLLGDIKV